MLQAYKLTTSKVYPRKYHLVYCRKYRRSEVLQRVTIRRKILTLFLVVPLSLAVGHSAESSKADTAVVGLENAWKQAELHHDMKSAGALLADTFFYVDGQGELQNKTEYVKGIGDKSYRPQEIRNEDLRVVMYGDTAIVTSAYFARGVDSGERFAQRGRFVDVWIKLNGRWLCVSSQDTFLAQ